MTDFRAIAISDIHLSAERPFFFHNWDVAVDWIRRERPDFVLCCGDIALNAPASPADLDFARRQIERLGVPVHVVPGNHDVGNCVPDIRGEHGFTPRLRDTYLQRIGSDRFSFSVGRWTFIGIDALMCGSDTDVEAEQRAWLEQELARHGGQEIALIMHKPLFRHTPDEDGLNQGSIYPAPRAALKSLMEAHDVRRIISGHNHEFLHETRHGFECIWVPSTAFISDGGTPTRGGGVRRQGLLDLRFAGGEVDVELIELDDMLTVDIASWLKNGIGLYEHYTSVPFRRP